MKNKLSNINEKGLKTRFSKRANINLERSIIITTTLIIIISSMLFINIRSDKLNYKIEKIGDNYNIDFNLDNSDINYIIEVNNQIPKKTTKLDKPGLKSSKINIQGASTDFRFTIKDWKQPPITTQVIIAENLNIEKATITLAKYGNVDTIVKCKDISVEANKCNNWEQTDIEFTETKDTITFEVTEFSAYGGAYYALSERGYMVWIDEVSDVVEYSGWNGNSWGPVTTLLSGYLCAATATVRLAANPVNEEEIAVATVGYPADTYKLGFFNGTHYYDNYTSPVISTADGYSGMDLEYDKDGNLMFLYSNRTDSTVWYRFIAPDHSVTSEGQTNLLHEITATYINNIKLASDPNSNYMAAIYMTNGKEVYAEIWNGTHWFNSTLLKENNAALNHYPIDVDCNNHSVCMFTYVESGFYHTLYNISNHTYFAETTHTDQGAGEDAIVTANPSTNEFIWMTSDNSNDVIFEVWRDNSLIYNDDELELTLPANDYLGIQAEYINETHAMVVYSDTTAPDLQHYRIWNGVTSNLSVQQDISDQGAVPNQIRLTKDSRTNEMMLIEVDSTKDLARWIWDGNAWGNAQANVDTSVPRNTMSVAADVVFWTMTPREQKALIVWDDRTPGTIGQYRLWRNDSTYSDEADTIDQTAAYYPFIIEMAASPKVGKEEAIFASMDTLNKIHVQVWNGTKWGNNLTMGITSFYGSGANVARGLDVEYFNDSHALVVWFDYETPITTDNSIAAYAVWNGNTWTEMNNTEDVTGIEYPYQQDLDCDPNSNECVLVQSSDTAFSVGPVFAQVWNGTHWYNYTTLADGINDYTHTGVHGVDVEYDHDGNAIVVFASYKDFKIKYAIWNGTNKTWSSPINATSSFGTNIYPYFLELAKNSNSNEMAIIATDSQNDIHVAVWDGSSWDNEQEVETTGLGNYYSIDIEYEQQSGRAIAIWLDDTPDKQEYIIWNSTNWVDQAYTASNIRGISNFLASDPDSDEMILMSVDAVHDIYTEIWDGTEWGNVLQIEPDQSHYYTRGFSAVYFKEGDINNPPTVTLVNPEDTVKTPNTTIIFNCSVTDDNGLVNMTLYHNITGTWHANNTQNISGTSNSVNWTITDIPFEKYIWNCLAYDNAGLSDWGNSNYTLEILPAKITINQSTACINSINYYPNITAGINAASNGDTIYVCPGYYDENVSVNKNVKIKAVEGTTDTIADQFTITSSGASIINFTINSSTYYGINIKAPTTTILENNITTSCEYCYAIRLWEILNTNISENKIKTIRKNTPAIYSRASNHTRMFNNNITTNGDYYSHGIRLYKSTNNTINNTIFNTTSFTIYPESPAIQLQHYNHSIPTTNKVNTRSIYYFFNKSSETLLDNSYNDIGEVIIAYSNKIILDTINTYTKGITFVDTENSTIKDSTVNVTNGNYTTAVQIIRGENNTVYNNNLYKKLATYVGPTLWIAEAKNNTNISSNYIETRIRTGQGIRIQSSNYSTIYNNKIIMNCEAHSCPGLYLYINSNNNTFTNNNITGVEYGEAIMFGYSNLMGNNISNNYIRLDKGHGIKMILPGIIKNNIFVNNNLTITGTAAAYRSVVVSCAGCTVDHNNFTNNKFIMTGSGVHGIYLATSSDTALKRNVVDLDESIAEYSLQFVSSPNNIFIDNIIEGVNTSFHNYSGDVDIKGVPVPEDDPLLYDNISKYLNITGTDWLFLNISYNDTNINHIQDESSLKILRHDGTGWTEDLGTSINSVNTVENYVYANITQFSDFGPFAQGNNSNLTGYHINLTGHCTNNINFYGNYTNTTGGHIREAQCNITFGDIIGVYAMTDTGIQYHYKRTEDWAGAGQYTYNISCYKIGYDHLWSNHSIKFDRCGGAEENEVPEFDLNGLIMAILVIAIGHILINAKQKRKLKK